MDVYAYRYFSVIVFCGIGLPGFVVSIALPIVALISVLSMSFVVDKVSRLFPDVTVNIYV